MLYGCFVIILERANPPESQPWRRDADPPRDKEITRGGFDRDRKDDNRGMLPCIANNC